MKRKSPEEIDALFESGTEIDEALTEAAWDAWRVHKQAGLPLVMRRDGKVVWVSPDEFEKMLREDEAKEGETADAQD